MSKHACVTRSVGGIPRSLRVARSLQPPKPKQCRKLHAVRFLPVRLTMRWLHVISKRHTHRCTCFVVMVPAAPCDDRQIFAHRSPTALPIDRPTDQRVMAATSAKFKIFLPTLRNSPRNVESTFVRSFESSPTTSQSRRSPDEAASSAAIERSITRFPAVVGTSILRTYGSR